MTEKRKTSAGSEDAYQDFHPENYIPTGEFRKREGCLPFSQSPSGNKNPSSFMEDSEEAGNPAELTISSEKTERDVSPIIESPSRRISSRQRRLSLEEYRTTFLQVPRIDDRKPVFISGSVRDKLDRIVRTLGTRRMSVSGLLENLATHHLEMYRDDLEQWRKL